MKRVPMLPLRGGTAILGALRGSAKPTLAKTTFSTVPAASAAGRPQSFGSIKRVGEANSQRSRTFSFAKKISVGIHTNRCRKQKSSMGYIKLDTLLEKVEFLIKYLADSIECAILAHKNTFIMLNTYKQRVFVLINFSG